MADILKFLKLRNVDREAIDKLKNDKIDAYVINVKDDISLSKYLPIYGDRLALYNYCKEGNVKKMKKPGLFEKLKRKMNLKSTDVDISDEDEKGTSNAIKGERIIQVGWIHRTSKVSFTQVRTRDGGGPRKVSVEKGAVKSDILFIAKAKFFPNGMSSKGPIENFIIDVWDFARNKMPDTVTVGEIYEKTGLSQLRYYLYTENKITQKEDSKLKKKQLRNDKQGEEYEVSNLSDSSDDLPQIDCPKKKKAFSRCHDEIYEGDNDGACTSSTLKDDERACNPPVDILRLAAIESNIIEDDEDSDIIQFGSILNSSTTYFEDTLPLVQQTFEISYKPTKSTSVRVHRGQVFDDLVEFFQKKNEIELDNGFTTIEMVLPNGMMEAAEDSGGVMRDCLCEFWKSFYEKCTTGGTYKLPYLRHDFYEDRWKAIAKIIVIGWRQEGYFPIEISKAFMEQCMHGETTDSLVEAFLDTVSPTDKDVLKMATTDFSSISQDELLDILDNYDCQSLPTANNCNEIIHQLAHKAIIQEPNFVIDAWNSIFCTSISGELTKEKMNLLYENLQPTPRKVIGMIQYPTDMNISENTVSKHLQRFIKDLNKQNLSDFLRFVTGSDLLVKEKIFLRYVELSGLARRPVAHTCGCVLELPRMYANYPDFKTEFLSVLQSSVWVMDII